MPLHLASTAKIASPMPSRAISIAAPGNPLYARREMVQSKKGGLFQLGLLVNADITQQALSYAVRAG